MASPAGRCRISGKFFRISPRSLKDFAQISGGFLEDFPKISKDFPKIFNGFPLSFLGFPLDC